MRRRLHGLVVGVLTLSLSFDVASACGHRRRACRPRSCQPVACEPLPQCPTWSAGWHSTWCGPALPVVVVAPVELWAGCAAGYETVAACDPLACCEGTVVEESFVGGVGVGAPVEAVGSVEDLAPAAAGSAPATEEPAVSRLAAGEPTLSIPPAALEPVPPREPEASKSEVEPAAAEQAVADESPVAQPQPEPAVPEPAPAAPAPRRIPNIFEEVDAAAAPAADESPVGPVDQQPAPADSAPGADAEPAEEPPAADAPQPDPPTEGAPSADSAARDPAEPRRRWIDDSGAHAAVGSLVAVHGAAVEILKSNGRMITVPVERLSDFDRAYVAAAGARLAARRPQAPARDTAGL